MESVCPTKAAVFFKLQFIWSALFVLCRCIILALALSARQRDYISHNDPLSTWAVKKLLTRLFNNLRDNAGAYGSTAFTDSEPEFFLHGDRSNQTGL